MLTVTHHTTDHSGLSFHELGWLIDKTRFITYHNIYVAKEQSNIYYSEIATGPYRQLTYIITRKYSQDQSMKNTV